MKAVVVTFPGSNCDQDLYEAVRQAGGDPVYQWHGDRGLPEADVVLLPGGFSYGDYLRAGAIARFSPVMEDVIAYAGRGGPVLGVCNGFQILCEAGLLPGALVRNRDLRFRSETVHVRVERADTLFTSEYAEGDVLRIPIAHAEGNYRAGEETVRRLEGEGRIVFRYTDADGVRSPASNPNGSAGDIAGILNDRGNVLGMMPHPERATEAVHGSTDGLGVFTSLISRAGAAATR